MCSNAAKEDAFNFQWGGSIKVTGGPEAFRTKQGRRDRLQVKPCRGEFGLLSCRTWSAASLSQTEVRGNNTSANAEGFTGDGATGLTVESEREMFAASAGMEGCSLNPSFSLADQQVGFDCTEHGQGWGWLCGVLQQRLKQMDKTVIYDHGTASRYPQSTTCREKRFSKLRNFVSSTGKELQEVSFKLLTALSFTNSVS